MKSGAAPDALAARGKTATPSRPCHPGAGGIATPWWSDLDLGTTLNDALLDHILNRQFFVAWAAEKPRLGWWADDVTDLGGGGDFFARWLGQVTERSDDGRWAAMEASRRTAIAHDGAARNGIVGGRDQDDVITLFHLGPEVDRLLDDRLRWRRQNEPAPEYSAWEGPVAFARALGGADAATWETVPGGREVAPPRYRLDANSRYKLREEHVEQLVLALRDRDGRVTSRYPVPFIDQRRIE